MTFGLDEVWVVEYNAHTGRLKKTTKNLKKIYDSKVAGQTND